MPFRSPEALAAALASPVPSGDALFDVRETGEAHRGHVPGATFLPRRQIEMRIEALVPRRDTGITVYDSGAPDDSRARRAAHTLGRLGWSSVHVLQGGLVGWRAAGQALAQGSNVTSKRFGELLHAGDRVPSIGADELARWQREGRAHLVCDIRSPEEFVRKRIPGAVGAFGVELALLAPELAARDMPIVVHCSGRTRSIVACRSLQLLGVPAALALENGTMGWHLAGHALDSGEGTVLDAAGADRAAADARAMALALSVGARRVDPATLSGWMDARRAGRANVYPIDVRQLDAYRAGHLPGSIAVPGGLAIQRADEFVPVRGGSVVFIDDGEARAALAAYWYARMGFGEVCVLEGGLDAWKALGRPIALGRDRAAPLDLAEARAIAHPADARAVHEACAQGTARVLWVDTSAGAARGRPEGAEWVRYGELEDRLAALAPADRQACVLACRDGTLSTLGAANLSREGLAGVRVLDGGMRAWEAARLPTQRGRIEGADDLFVQPYDGGPEAMRRYLEWETTLTAQRAEDRTPLHADRA